MVYEKTVSRDVSVQPLPQPGCSGVTTSACSPKDESETCDQRPDETKRSMGTPGRSSAAAEPKALLRDSQYELFIARNKDYVGSEIQQKIAETTVMIAGCGMGSMFAEGALRLGFRNIILVDGDTIDTHNLNRQNFVDSDIGASKVEALKSRLMSVYPDAEIAALHEYINPQNVARLVQGADVVFDTVDFLDLPAIVSLHDACHENRIPIISALNIGWGAGCLYFPAGGSLTLRSMLGLPHGDLRGMNYVDAYEPLINRLSEQLPPDVVRAITKAMGFMEDGKPCPASQLIVGTHAVSSMAVSILYRVIADLPVTEAPELLALDMNTVLTGRGIDLS